jgi:hypothetical protein
VIKKQAAYFCMLAGKNNQCLPSKVTCVAGVKEIKIGVELQF